VLQKGEDSEWRNKHMSYSAYRNTAEKNIYKSHSNNIHQQYNSDSLKLWDRFYKIYIIKKLAGENNY